MWGMGGPLVQNLFKRSLKWPTVKFSNIFVPWNGNLYAFKFPIRDVQITEWRLGRGIYIDRMPSTNYAIYIVLIHNLK